MNQDQVLNDLNDDNVKEGRNKEGIRANNNIQSMELIQLASVTANNYEKQALID